MKGARALASGMLVLAAICAVPAVSAAQDSGAPADATTTTTTTTTADPVLPPVDPEASSADPGKRKPPDPGGDPQQQQQQDPVTTTAAAAAPPVTVSGPTGKAQASASASVTMDDFFFSPASVTVAVGDTVTWHNAGQAPHTATADDGSFDTGTINSGGSGSHRFTTAGTFSYICTIHPNMHGTVRVLSSSGGGGGSGGGNSGSSSSGSATSEASAVASPDAAGNSSTLPMTGMAVGSLALVGLALLAMGLIARRADQGRPSRRWLSIF